VPKSILDSLPTILLMGPGPSCVADPVYAALAQPTIGHMDLLFIDIMNEIKVLLQRLLNTQNRLTVPMSGTGSSGMETCFVNLVEKGDRVLILINGVFGMRMKDVATRLGAQVDALEFEWGTPVLMPEVERALAAKKYSIVAVVHAETSTGVRNPVDEISALVKKNGALYLVDTVTSLGGIEVRMDEWNIDVLYSGTQKCLSCPPGLSPVSFSERAIDKLNRRKSAVPNWYLDLSMIMKYWEGNTRVYHHTAPVNMLYGLHAALSLILAEGTDKVFARHLENHLLLVKGLADLGLEMLVKEPYRLPMLNAVKIPEGADDIMVRNILRIKYEIEIGGGLGPLAGKVWRIGLMGHTARRENVIRLLTAMKSILQR
jgi:alanine-glyoxylate transaminase / serine-glyoxylate transaminase / serine-pyruvate transaminase